MSSLHYGKTITVRTSAGLTLLELIIALAILAVLSTVAVRALDPLADQARYEATRTMLKDLRCATVGDSNSKLSDGQCIISGFLADNGRFPADLSELLTQPVDLIGSSVQTFDSNRDATDDVSLTSGWRGPYLQLGAGQIDILDGWGRTVLVDPDGGEFDFTSLGSDNDSIAPEDGYRADLVVEMPIVSYSDSITFRLFDIDGGTGTRVDPAPTGTQQLGVLVYAINVNGGTDGSVEELLVPIAASGTFEVTLSSMIQGKAAARGILWDDLDSDQVLDVGEAILSSSYVHYFTFLGAMDLRIEMELR